MRVNFWVVAVHVGCYVDIICSWEEDSELFECPMSLFVCL